ncbi:flagellar hook-associated protein FlgL [Pseudomonas chengduensis]|nr:flagellar hook-associated protein FlgL [Pseudomonas chengduensis]MDH0622793.1 flagellar hook-associated protein FlgL [Pseudomonas chengduensis]MDH1280481.1 flagellar hook-associated protein FlgL [Pseudomonas chengduensis]MDH1665470.1 flagellar hook-associated protein FlgL [Pseudomonas chengduensis]
MRISTIQAFNNGVNGLQRNYANVTRTQEQISTGNRILTPADDPVASVRLLQLEQQQAVLKQYNANLNAAQNSLTQEESTLVAVENVLQRVRELTIRAGNGSLNQGDRQSIAAELAEREDELLSLMNTRNARGEYLFAGFQGKTQPFVRQPDGSYAYTGDDGQRQVQIASSLELPISDSGRAIFGSGLNAARLTVDIADGTIGGLLVQDEVSYGSFPDGGFSISFDAGDPLNYTLTPSDGSPAISGWLSEGKDTALTYQGVSFYVNGTPAPGSSYTVTGPDPAANMTDDPQVRVNPLNVIADLRQVLENSTDGREIRDAVSLSIANLDASMDAVDQGRGQIGARMNVVSSTLADNENVALVNQATQAELRELDYPEALSRLSLQSTVLEAAQQSYVRIANLSLFNLL